MSAPPHYTIEVEAWGLGGELRVNDIPVLTLPEGRVETRFDVNMQVRTGRNMLAVHLGPERGAETIPEGARCRVTLSEAASAGTEDTKLHAALGFDPGPALSGFQTELGAPLVRRLEITAIQEFELTTPFGPWAWTSAERLCESEGLRTELVEAYLGVHRLLENLDVDALLELCAGQAADYRVAYGLSDDDAGRELIGIRETLATPGLEIEPFGDGLLHLQILGEGRLARLVDGESRSPLRMGLTGQPDVRGRFNVIFARGSNGWEIAR